MTHRMYRLTALVMLALFVTAGVSGCAQKRSTANWQNPDLPQEAWGDDIGECRRFARREVEREAGIPAAGPVTDNLPGMGTTYQNSMNRFELQQIQQRAFDDCMRRLGYKPVVK
ncbi:MAG: hypothetical protein WD075_08985 [Rhodospirillales bacterium]